MRRPHERQPCRLSLTLPRAGPGHLRPTHGKGEEAPGTRFGQAQGRRGACNWAHGHPPARHRRRAGDRNWWLCGTHGQGQHPTEAFDFPGGVFKLSAKRPGPSSMVQAHPEVLTMPQTWTVITGRSWESLVAVKVAAAKGSSYAMLTTVHKIHKAVIGGDQGSWPEGQKSKRKRKTEQEL